ncbi:hypothetical protein ODD08_004039 [Salmonella enterica]|nr:hypothetical protein [Salmonella enterica]
MIRLIFIVLISSLLVGCSVQQLYTGSIAMVNPCKEPLKLNVLNYNQYIGTNVNHYDEKEKSFQIGLNERKVIAFITLTSETQDFSYAFTGSVQDVGLVITNSNGRKIISGKDLYYLIKKSPSNIDAELSFEINNPSICP